MTFYSSSESTFTRLHRDEMAMSFSAIDCVLNGELAVYASTELTSGKRLFDLCEQHHVKSSAELKSAKGSSWYGTNLWNANVSGAAAFAQRVKAAVKGEVITPAPFTAPGWSQPEYLAFWETLIRTRISACWFNDSWQYSNGCTFEFAVAHDAGLPTLDASGQTLSLVAGVDLIAAAIAELESRGFDPVKLRENRDRLVELPRFRAAVSTR